MIMNDVVIFVSLESEAADWHGEWALLEASGVSPLEQDGVELPGAEVLITVLVKQRVNHVDHMSIQLLIIIYVEQFTENGAVFKTAQNTFNIKWRRLPVALGL